MPPAGDWAMVGTHALIDVLLLHRQLSAAAVDAGISAVLAVGSVDVEV